MLRVKAVSAIYIESQALELLSAARRDVYKLFRTSSLSTQAPSSQVTIVSLSTPHCRSLIKALVSRPSCVFLIFGKPFEVTPVTAYYTIMVCVLKP